MARRKTHTCGRSVGARRTRAHQIRGSETNGRYRQRLGLQLLSMNATEMDAQEANQGTASGQGLSSWDGVSSLSTRAYDAMRWEGTLLFPKAGATLDAPALSEGTYALAVVLLSNDGRRR